MVRLEPSVLTDEDIAKLLKAIDVSWERRMLEVKMVVNTQFESIGYDLSTPKSRNAIRLNNDFLDDIRKGTGKVKMAAVGVIAMAMLAELGRWMVTGLWDTIRATMSAKGVG